VAEKYKLVLLSSGYRSLPQPIASGVIVDDIRSAMSAMSVGQCR
jgi:hypothetical protein